MSSPDAFTVIHDHLVDNWSAIPLAFENDGYEKPSDPDYFVYVEVVGDFFDQASIGAEPQTDNLWREEGVLYLHVMTPRGAGSLQARTYGKQLANLFRGQEINGVVFRAISLGGGGAPDEDGNYWPFTVTIDWQRDQGR